MRLIFWVTALAVLCSTWAKNSTAKTKPKRQLENIRTPQNLQYSLVLPHSRVAHFRALTHSSTRRISNAPPRGGKLPPYAVQMEPVVQYSQKDPLYDPSLDNLDDSVVNKNEIYAQPKILNVHDQSPESSFGPPYGALPTAPLYSHEPHPHYIEAPEPIIEIIIKESNESLPAPPPQLVPKKKKEPVQVFYVKYSKDPHSKDKVVYEKPVPAITPPTNAEDDHHEEYVTVTPEPLYLPTQTTTLRAIIKPESELYHSDSSVKVTFGNEGQGRHYGSRHEESSEDHEETAPRPAIALPNQQHSNVPFERSASPTPQHIDVRPAPNAPSAQNYRPAPHAQNRIQFQQPYLNNDFQLPRQGPSVAPFRVQSHISRQNAFGPSPSLSPHPAFSNPSPSPSSHFINNAPTVPGPIGHSTSFSRPTSTFHPRPNPPPFGSRPHFNGPPRASFHSGPQRPFHQPQPQPFFDEPKYLQENYHTITTDQVEPAKEQVVSNRPTQTFNISPKPSPSPAPIHFHDHQSRPQQLIPFNQQLPQQRPPQQFDSTHSKPAFPVTSNRSPFYNLKPSPPLIDDNRPPFQRQPQQHFSFHQGPQPVSRPSAPITSPESIHSQNSFSSHISASPSPSPIPHNQFLPQPSSPPLFNFHPQPSAAPEQHHFQQPSFASERPQLLPSHGPSERPPSHQNFQDQSQHQQNVEQFVPHGGELVPAISKYEQHITVNGPNSQPTYSLTSNQPSSAASHSQQQYQQQQSQHQQEQQKQQQQQQHEQRQREQQQKEQRQREQQQHEQRQREQQQHEQQQRDQQQQIQQHQQQLQQQQQYLDSEQQQVRLQLAQNVRKQQEEIQRLQAQLVFAQQQQQQQQQHQQRQNYQQVQPTSPQPQYIQERARPQPTYVSSTSSPPYYQSTSRTVEIKPSTQKYISSTANSVSTTPEPKKEEKKKKPTIELPDEVPDDLRQQLLSSGILDNADISVLDYDKVGETPLESLPPDQLANFFSAGGGQQIASSEHRPIVVKPNGDRIESRIDEDADEDDQDIAASENVPSYVAPPPNQKQAVEMKVVHFDPDTAEGQNIAKGYVKEDATQVDPVALNDKKYNRYLPLKVSGNQFPLPDILKGRKITSVVVLAPVKTEPLSGDHPRTERAASDSLKGIKFVAGDSLHDLLKKPTKDNFEKWLQVEKQTASDEQSVILLVTGNDKPEEREIFMYDISSGNVNKLSGDLSNAFVEAAENNSLSKDIEKLAIEGEGTPENFDNSPSDDAVADGSENVPLFVDLSGVTIDSKNNNQVSISSGYSKTKLGRALRRH
ncbi:uncharacterized protein [Epargyreus clarus]|uniref:uncharacterized protein n=1 Tax=Epargyreus clarus TaxID=520877 RepID=UPI003C2F7190